jgi:hypothetical protein
MCVTNELFCQISFPAVEATASGAVIGASSTGSETACSFSAQPVTQKTNPTINIKYLFMAAPLQATGRTTVLINDTTIKTSCPCG